ncbi:MAG: sulfatase-like hydrolase/transferase [Verrucomicrobiota bacterium]
MYKKSFAPTNTNKRVYEVSADNTKSYNKYPDGQIKTKVIQELQNLKNTENPFFIACGFVRPHLPFYAPKKYWDLYDRASITIADNQYKPINAPDELVGSNEFWAYDHDGIEVNSSEWHRMMRHGYYACVSYVDDLVGEILEELDTLGLANNTLIVLWGDHGFHLGEHNYWSKHNTLYHSTRIPLIFKGPGVASGTANGMIESVDIFPTLCDLAGIAKPSQLHGKSFTSVSTNPAVNIRDHVYVRYDDLIDGVVTLEGASIITEIIATHVITQTIIP